MFILWEMFGNNAKHTAAANLILLLFVFGPLCAGVNVFLRKIAVTAASSPAVEITQQEESLSIKTSTSVRTTNVSFTVGQSFNETTVDGRPCTVHITVTFLYNVNACIPASCLAKHSITSTTTVPLHKKTQKHMEIISVQLESW